ncbi:MAG TPA: IclR family transcriptional regulator [Bacillota bacterium]|jgi:DNA-binding IclR family transcriptional regulator|nr:IclR family transcriptional regulator [Bacillota bacterium]
MAKVGRTVQAVDRTLGIMEEMAQIGRPATLTEISKKVGLNISTTHRLLYTLIAQGYAEQDYITGRYRLGYKAIQIGQSALLSLDIRREATPRLERLGEQIARSLYLCVRLQEELIVIYRYLIEGQNAAIPPVGGRMPIYSTAPGRLFLNMQKNSSTEPLWSYYVAETKDDEGCKELVVPIFDHTLRPIGAITLVSLNDTEVCQFLPALQSTAWEISRQLGAEGAPGGNRNLGNSYKFGG